MAAGWNGWPSSVTYRGRGIGSAILHRTFRALAARGQRRVMLTVNAENLTGATGAYERAGMRVVNRWDLWERVGAGRRRQGRDHRTSQPHRVEETSDDPTAHRDRWRSTEPGLLAGGQGGRADLRLGSGSVRSCDGRHRGNHDPGADAAMPHEHPGDPGGGRQRARSSRERHVHPPATRPTSPA